MKKTGALAAVLFLFCLLVTPGCSKPVKQPEESSVGITTSPVNTIEPIEMLGQWEPVWTEVEGDRNEADPGTGCIFIFLNDQDAMLITRVEEAFPEDSFFDQKLTVLDGEMYPGCGNDRWIASVEYVGEYDTVYSVTLLEDDTLLMQMYWQMDGAPMVSYSGYRRVGG